MNTEANIKNMREKVIIEAAFITAGCSTTTKMTKTKTETEISRDETGEEKSIDKESETPEKTSTKTETAVSSGQRGIIGTIFHFIGEILALPFRIAGELIRAIF